MSEWASSQYPFLFPQPCRKRECVWALSPKVVCSPVVNSCVALALLCAFITQTSSDWSVLTHTSYNAGNALGYGSV